MQTEWCSPTGPVEVLANNFSAVTLDSKGNYSATSNNTKLVHWPLMGGLLHLVQRGGAWAGCGPAICTKCNSLWASASSGFSYRLRYTDDRQRACLWSPFYDNAAMLRCPFFVTITKVRESATAALSLSKTFQIRDLQWYWDYAIKLPHMV